MAQKGSLAYAQAKGAPAGFVLGLLQIASRARGVISATTSWTKLQDYYLNSSTALVRITAKTNGAIVAFSRHAAAAVRASGTLTSDNTNVADGATVTIGTTVYTFKNTPAAAYDVAIGASADASLGNLIAAINASGIGDGSDYFTGTAEHPTVFADPTITAHAFTVYAKAFGTAGTTIVTTETSAHLSWGGLALAGGVDGNFEDYIPAGQTKEYTIDDSVSYLSFLGDGGTSSVYVVEY